MPPVVPFGHGRQFECELSANPTTHRKIKQVVISFMRRGNMFSADIFFLRRQSSPDENHFVLLNKNRKILTNQFA